MVLVGILIGAIFFIVGYSVAMWQLNFLTDHCYVRYTDSVFESYKKCLNNIEKKYKIHIDWEDIRKSCK